MLEFSAVAALIGAIAFGLLTLLLIAGHRGTHFGRALIAASLLSTIWFGTQSAYYYEVLRPFKVAWLQGIELLRNGGWILVIALLLNRIDSPGYVSRIKLLYGATTGLIVVAAMALSLVTLEPAFTRPYNPFIVKLLFLTYLALAVCGLVLVEQLYRNTNPDTRWAIKHLCFAIAAIFAYDFVLYADSTLFNQINPDMWAARGAVNALVVPLIGVAAVRNKQSAFNLFVSRKVVFHSTAVIGAGLYLLAMAAAGYYVRIYGGAWGGALRVVLICISIVIFVALVSSVQLRSALSAFLARHFYRNKYDYGEVWLSFTRKLAEIGADPNELRQTILSAIADIMNSTGGLMWQKTSTGDYALVARWALDGQGLGNFSADTPLIQALQCEEHIIDLHDEAAMTTIHRASVVPPALLHLSRAWLVVPIVHGEELLAFLVLAESRSNAPLTWEDRDILKTVGRQAASYLALLCATEALADSRQFDAFNRLSAFLVHDLKNVVAQLSLVTRNAQRHGNNPEFISDAFNTVNDAVAKMNRMLGSLRQSHGAEDASQELELNDLMREAVRQRRERKPQPTSMPLAHPVVITGNRDRLLSVLVHLLENAQDATDDSGTITVSLTENEGKAIIEIADTGCGMDSHFIQNRLFKPFDTTKGKAGMGIGVYESLHVISGMGGKLSVESTPGEGTRFRISFPLASAKSAATSSSTSFRQLA